MTRAYDPSRPRKLPRPQADAISHDDALARLGYKPDEAAVRMRRAQPPQLPKPVKPRHWWQRG